MRLENRTISLVEDDVLMGESLSQRLALEGADVHWWHSAGEAIEAISRLPGLDAVVCDIRLPDGSGETVFREVSAQDNPPPFLFMTGFGDIDQAVRLIRAGGGDYLTKPFDMPDFLDRLEHLIGGRDPLTEPRLGVSAAMISIERLLHRLARSNANVLITGETGVGKEVCARYLHAISAQRGGPFIAVNCAAIPEELLESELFGHEKGAFSGAVARHLGYAERSKGGTLFLDEIGELSPRMQSKLLRLIESRSFSRVGGEQVIGFDARLVTATNADLAALIRAGKFREDLFYRINVVGVSIPALRERREDIAWLANLIFDLTSANQDDAPSGLSEMAIKALEEHDWPGNARELRNRIERATVLALGPWIMPGDLFPEKAPHQGRAGIEPDALQPLDAARDEAERRHILKVLKTTKGAIQPAARILQVSRSTLWEKMRRLDISVDGHA